jgi:hypothetical protein
MDNLQEIFKIPKITVKNIHSFIFDFFNTDPEKVNNLLKQNWRTYKFCSESCMLEYKVINNTNLIKCDSKISLPEVLQPIVNATANQSAKLQGPYKEDLVEIEVIPVNTFLDIFKKHISQLYSCITADYKFNNQYLLDTEYTNTLGITQDKKLLILGHNKSIVCYDIDCTYLYHASVHIPITFFPTINIDKINFESKSVKKKLHKLLCTNVAKISSLEDIFTKTDTAGLIFEQPKSDFILFDLKNIPSISLSKTFVPTVIGLKKLDKINKKAINLFKQFENVGKNIFSIFKRKK